MHYVHLDDALALVLLVAAMLAVTRQRPVMAALLLAASADAKPWAVAFVPLLLALPRDRWARALGAWAAGLAVAWLPFLLADPGTVHAGRFAIPNDASSSLRALGITAPGTPMWDRPVQVLLGVALAVVAVRRGRWLAVPAVVLSVRMLLDPATYPYYGAGLVLATVLVDLGVRRTRWPWLSIGVVAGTYVLRHLGPLTPTDPQARRAARGGHPGGAGRGAGTGSRGCGSSAGRRGADPSADRRRPSSPSAGGAAPHLHPDLLGVEHPQRLVQGLGGVGALVAQPQQPGPTSLQDLQPQVAELRPSLLGGLQRLVLRQVRVRHGRGLPLPGAFQHVVRVGAAVRATQVRLVQPRPHRRDQARRAGPSARTPGSACGSRLRPSTRTSHGSVPPCSSSVPPATTNPISTSVDRDGVDAGSDCTAATVTAPRMPAHTSSTPSRQPNDSAAR